MITLGIETSCDETSICLYSCGKILSMQTFSQVDLHKVYGGVVPEIASRDHLVKIGDLFKVCLTESKVGTDDVDLIAYTSHPGLVGSLMTGVMFANGLRLGFGLRAKTGGMVKMIPVNHLLAHVFTCNISHGVSQNFICLLISGGHTFIYDIHDVCSYKILGKTIDDSIGEVFDKLSKSIGLGYPGGVVIESIAKFGNGKRYKFKIPLIGKDLYNFSLSGIKTEFLKLIQNVFDESGVPRGTDVDFILGELTAGVGKNLKLSQDVADICASFQTAIVRILVNRLENCAKDFNFYGINFVVCGGVASNQFIRDGLMDFCLKHSMKFCAPPVELCTDNSAMVANVGELMFKSSTGSVN